MKERCVKERLKKEIDRQREHGFSGMGLMADALKAIEILEQANQPPLPDNPDKPVVKAKAIDRMDIVEQLRTMGWACSLQIPNVNWSQHPSQVCQRAMDEIRRLRHDLDLIREENGGCDCGIISRSPGEESGGEPLDVGADTGEEGEPED